MDLQQQTIEESDNEESHHRSSRAGSSSRVQRVGEVRRASHHSGNKSSQLTEQYQSFDAVEATSPFYTGENKFSFMDCQNNNDGQQNQDQDREHHSLPGQSSAESAEVQWRQGYSLGQQIPNQRVGLDLMDHEDQPQSNQMLPVQPESRNLDNDGLGGQSAGVYGHAPDSGTLKQVAHEVSENFRSQTAKQQSRAPYQAQPEHLDPHTTSNQHQTGSTACARARPSEIMRVQTRRKAFSRHGEEDDDEPSLQSPAPQMIKQMERQAIQEESEPCSGDEFSRAAAEQEVPSPALSSGIGPQPEALSVTKYQITEPIAALPSPVPPQPRPEREPIESSRLPHLTESPSLPTRNAARKEQDDGATPASAPDPQTEIPDEKTNENREQDEGGSKIDGFAEDDHGLSYLRKKTHPPAIYRSDCKQSVPRSILDINVLDYNNTAKLGKGLLALEGLAEAAYQDGKQSECKTARELVSSSFQSRSKSHTLKSPFRPAMANAPAELQAHIDRLRMRSSLQAQQLPFAQASTLSPFQKGAGQVQPHFESLYQIQMQQNQLSTFDGQSQYSAALRSGNPLGQSLNQLNQFSLTQQQLRLASKQSQMDADSQGGGLMMAHQAPAGGHQYEVLLKERADLTEKLEEMQSTIDSQRKQINQLKSQQSLMKFDIDERTDDLDDVRQKLTEKEKMVVDLKDTLRRQNEQIDQLREDLSKADQKEREARHNNDVSVKKITELQQQLKQQQFETKCTSKEGGDNPQDSKQSELMQNKAKEIYNLTVELGSLREENNELQKNVDQQKQDFQERLKEQRERHDTEYNKVVDELELLKIESEERLDATKKTIEQQIEKIRSLENSQDIRAEYEQKTHTLESQLAKKDQECAKKQELCHLQQEEITQLTKNYQVLNQQLDQLQTQLGGGANHRRRASNLSKVSQKKEDQTISGAGQLQQAQRDSSQGSRSNNKTCSPIVSSSLKNFRQLDHSPEIIGAKPGKVNENTRQNMIMSTSDQIDNEKANGRRDMMEDGLYTPINMSSLDEMGMVSNRNPIDTDCSRQQPLNSKPSHEDQGDSEHRTETFRDNGNQQDMYVGNENKPGSPSEMRRKSFNMMLRSEQPDGQRADPLFYDSLQDNNQQPNTTHVSNISSSRASAQHQLIARASQNSMEWQRCQSNQSNMQSVQSNLGHFQTNQQQSNSRQVVFEGRHNSYMYGKSSQAARSPLPTSTIYQQFRQNHSKLGAGGHLRMSHGKTIISTKNINNTQNVALQNSQLGENSDIGSKLITQRRKHRNNGALHTSQSTLLIQPADALPAGAQTSRGAMPAQSSASNNPLMSTRGSGNGINTGMGTGLGTTGKALGQRVMSTYCNQTVQGQTLQSVQSHKLLHNQQQIKPTRPSMLLGSNQTKAGLTPVQPLYNAQTVQSRKSPGLPHQGSAFAQQELSASKFGQTSHFAGSNSKTARQFLQRSPVPQQQHRVALQTSRQQNIGQSQPSTRTQNQIRDGQQSAGAIARKNKETNLSSARRACQSQRIPDYRKKIPSRHGLVSRPGGPPDQMTNEAGGGTARREQAFTDASNRQARQSLRYNKVKELDTQMEDPAEDQHADTGPYADAIPQTQKENCWMDLSASQSDAMDKTFKPQQMHRGVLDASANADSCDGEDHSQGQLSRQFNRRQNVLQYDPDMRQGGAATARGPVMTSYSRGSTTPRDCAPAATARAYTGTSQERLRKSNGNMNDMRAKLQSIQTGKAYLEKKIQEYESRLNQMKVKKDRQGRKDRMKNA